ncbi:MAG: acyltransferase [Saprospiraceae bacterium]|nr:acyltransferase [Saprospiraceae bacterium]
MLPGNIQYPYFCPGQDKAWYESAETVPGPTIERMQEYAKKYNMVMIVPVYEKNRPVYCIILLLLLMPMERIWGKYRKNHIPHTSGFWEKFSLNRATLVILFSRRSMQKWVCICYDRHFPEGARALGLNGAEIVYNPSATVAGLSQYLWKLEQPAHAAANGYFMGCINRVGTEKPWNLGKFYGSSYFVDPRGQIFAQASEDNDELLIADFDLDMIEQVKVYMAILQGQKTGDVRKAYRIMMNVV